MVISKQKLSEMEALLGKGKTVADIAKKYPSYDYLEIRRELDDMSFRGKKKTISNRLRDLVSAKTRAERVELSKEAQELLDELYESLKLNSKELTVAEKLLRKIKEMID